MAIFSRILVAVDGSAPSDAAVQLALRLCAPRQNVCFLTALDRDAVVAGYTGEPSMAPAIGDGLRGAEAERRLVLEAASNVARAAGVEPISVLRTGAAVDAIVDEARQSNASCIVIGTHGRGGIARAVLGSCAEGVLRRSDVPVLIAHSGSIVDGADPFERILCAVDDSPAARLAFDAASTLAAERGAELHLLTVIDVFAASFALDGANPHRTMSAIYPEAQARIDAFAVEALAAGCRVNVHVVGGTNVAERIVECAKAEGCGLVMIGTHGRGGLSRAILGSTAEAVLRSGTIPVLAFRDPSEEHGAEHAKRAGFAPAPLPG
jgi:nucleotide-binding universal stress UspA family protein